MPDLVEAVVHVDLILACDFFPLEELAAYVADHQGWRGVPQARRAVALAAAGVRSPPETRMRLAWVLGAGLPTPLVNRAVFDLTGNLLGYPDLLDPEAGTVRSTTATTTASWAPTPRTTSGRSASSTTA